MRACLTSKDDRMRFLQTCLFFLRQNVKTLEKIYLAFWIIYLSEICLNSVCKVQYVYCCHKMVSSCFSNYWNERGGFQKPNRSSQIVLMLKNANDPSWYVSIILRLVLFQFTWISRHIWINYLSKSKETLFYPFLYQEIANINSKKLIAYSTSN